jgi:glycogen operon protein
MATLLLSQGVPMVLAGDELGHSQNGNNNAYCQDNETGWIDWASTDEAFLRFVQRMIELRKDHPDFRRSTFFSGLSGDDGRKDIVWLDLSGREMQDSDWHNPNLSSFGCTFGERDRFLCLFNASAEELAFVPTPEPGLWECILDSSHVNHRTGTVPAHSLMIFKSAPA